MPEPLVQVPVSSADHSLGLVIFCRAGMPYVGKKKQFISHRDSGAQVKPGEGHEAESARIFPDLRSQGQEVT